MKYPRVNAWYFLLDSTDNEKQLLLEKVEARAMQLGGQPAIDYGQARAYLSRAEYAIEYEDYKTAK